MKKICIDGIKFPSAPYTVSHSIRTMVIKIEEMIQVDGLDINPDFQRGHVWSESQQIAWIEHYLSGGKSGLTIYINHPGWMKNWEGQAVLVDGKQRIEAMRRFIADEFRVFAGKPIYNGSISNEGYLYSEIGNVNAVHDLTLAVNNLPTKNDVIRWYVGMNSGGSVHTKEEIDRALALMDS